jgi:hypothetical protein
MRSTIVRVWAAIVLSILAAWPAGAHSAAAGRAQCQGATQAGQTSCSTGLHDAFDWYGLGIPDRPAAQHGLLIFSTYTGSIESRLDWPAVNPAQQRSFRCDVISGVVTQSSCSATGVFPPPTVHFIHRCRSLKIGSPNESGGSGTWGCYVDHDASPPTPPAIVDRP